MLADLMGDLDKPFDELPRPIIELRFAAMVCRNKHAAEVFMGSEDDFSQDPPRQIVAAARRAIREHIPGGPTIANISSLSHIPEAELRALTYKVTGDLLSEFETYAAYIQAMGFKDRKERAYAVAHERMVRASWRDVAQVAAQTDGDTTRVQLMMAERGQNDIGAALERIKEGKRATRQIAFPWNWLNDYTDGGIQSGQKMYMTGVEGGRKSTMLYNAQLFWARNGEHVVSFVFDGGDPEAHAIKMVAIRWRQLCEQHKWYEWRPEGVPLTVKLDSNEEYAYINKSTAWAILEGKEEDKLNFMVPDNARELFWAAYDEMQALRSGHGPGRMTFVTPKEVHSRFDQMSQRLISEKYEGMTVWTFDNFTKGTGRAKEEPERSNELVRTLHAFTDEEQIPCLILAHMLRDIKIKPEEFKKRTRGFIKWGAPAEEDTDFLLILDFDDALPTKLPIFLSKNRDQAAGRKEGTVLTIEPSSGYIKEVV
jgi:hypothetical protein